MRHALAVAVCALSLAACSINVRDDYPDHRESCEVRCSDGSRAEVMCAKPRIPACSCEPAPTAACVKAHGGGGAAL